MRILLIGFLMLLSGCSLLPTKQLTTQPPIQSIPQPGSHSVQVSVTPGQFIDLPQPRELQQHINVSQLITAQWGEENSNQLLVQLQVDDQQVALAGFSAWGVKLLTLSYLGEQSGNKIDTNVMTGLAGALPDPEQVLFNVMIAIWPQEAWQAPLVDIGWTLHEDVLQRTLIDQQGNIIITIDYQQKPYLTGRITLKHHRLNYTVMIETKQ